jgi:biopolymer transport protein ExbD
MKVFKYLVALADISVGFLGLFFIIFAVARPTISSDAERNRLRQTVDSLRREIRELEQIKLGSAASGKKLGADASAKIIVAASFINVEILRKHRPASDLQYGNGAGQTRFASADEFAANAAAMPWPPNVVLYVDHRVPFEKVIAVIDALKRTGKDVTVQIAALAK